MAAALGTAQHFKHQLARAQQVRVGVRGAAGDYFAVAARNQIISPNTTTIKMVRAKARVQRDLGIGSVNTNISLAMISPKSMLLQLLPLAEAAR